MEHTYKFSLMNLILTVIVERAADARERDIHDAARLKIETQEDLKSVLLKICKLVDEDGNGRLTRHELLKAIDDNREFKDLMITCDIHKSELEIILRMLDKDGSGYLDYEEFCEELSRYKSLNQAMLLLMTKFSVLELEQNVQQKLAQVMSVSQSHEQMLTSISQRIDQVWSTCFVNNIPAAALAKAPTKAPAKANLISSCEEGCESVSQACFGESDLDSLQLEIQGFAELGSPSR